MNKYLILLALLTCASVVKATCATYATAIDNKCLCD